MPTDWFCIRPGEPRDLPAVVELIRGLAEFERLPGPTDEEAARFAEHFRARYFDLLVADEAGEPGGALVGYALFFMNYSTFRVRPSLFLEDLYVRPASRSRGLGGALMRRLAAVAVERGCARFEWTVLDWNVRAQSFYRSLGARLLPEWRICRVDGDDLPQLAARP